MTLRVSTLHRCIFFFLVFFIVFDGMRSNLIISDLVSPFRELGLNLFILLCLPLLKTVKKQDIKLALPFLLVSAFAIINIPVTLFNHIEDFKVGALQIYANKYSSVYKHILFSIIFLSFLTYARNNISITEKGIQLVITLAAIYSVITIPIYLFGFPLFKPDFRDWGRMGVGYPTMDGQMICFAIFCLIFVVKQKNLITFNIKMACLLLGIVAQNTGTAMVTMALILILSVFRKPLKTTSYIAIIGPFLLLIAMEQYLTNPTFFTDMVYIATNKINALIHPEMANQANLDTLQMREIQYDQLNKIMSSDPMLSLFGVGGQAYMENEFRLARSAFGLFSGFFFAASFIWMATYVFLNRNKNRVLLCALLVIWAFTSYTLASLQLFSTSFLFCLVFSHVYVQGLRKRHIIQESIENKSRMQHVY
ncbi:hypothetical protein [Pantoea cypripedii]|uniref:O-antigen ligase domain-containing protein n=1 Tax=Pantoea cypripedii TaxID=55209 RepID=A0A1X1EJZ2_PANCY|nr:hypothetical protein [Pantoea cypripedii]MBP2200322.1 hypothetical protein [Pantoea cypripedii]ORM89153.1 hypothetical protein HA50_21095 [Pantoea cypripedii]